MVLIILKQIATILYVYTNFSFSHIVKLAVTTAIQEDFAGHIIILVNIIIVCIFYY